jgi:hypothetical protein
MHLPGRLRLLVRQQPRPFNFNFLPFTLAFGNGASLNRGAVLLCRGAACCAQLALTIVQLAAVPLGIGTIAPATVATTGGATLTIRGSGFQSGSTVTINGKSTSVTFKDANTLSVATPSLTPGSQQITITNPDGESVSLDAAFLAN